MKQRLKNKVQNIDLNIIKFFLENDCAKSFYQIAKSFGDREHRGLYAARGKLHISQGILHQDGIITAPFLKGQIPKVKILLKELIDSHPDGMKRFVNCMMGETKTVKDKTFDEDLLKILMNSKVKPL